MKRIAVIGAGPAGCSAAYHLKKAGHQVTLYERDQQVGGRTLTNRDHGVPADTGAGFFTDFYPLLGSLIRDLNLKDAVQPLFRETTMVKGAERAELKIGSLLSFLQFPFLTNSQKLAMITTTTGLTLKRRSYDLVDPSKLARFDTETTEQWACRTVGREVYDTVVRPGVESFWYFSCDESSAAMTQALQARAASARFYTFKQGMDTICRALTQEIDCKLGATAQFIEPYKDKYTIRLDNKEWVDHHDGIVIATTAPIARQLIRKLPHETVPELIREYLASQRYVSHVHTAYRVPLEACKGFGPSVVPCGPGNHLVAAISRNSLKYPNGLGAPENEELLGVYLTETGSALMTDFDDETTYQESWNLARLILPELPETYTPHHIKRRPYAIPIPEVGRYKLAAEALKSQRGPVVFAGDYLATATVEGALRTGKWAADRLFSTVD